MSHPFLSRRCLVRTAVGQPLVLLLLATLFPAVAWGQKAQLSDSIRSRDDQTWRAAQKIWEWAEPGYQEHQSAKLLSDMLEQAGFAVQRGVPEIPTAFRHVRLW